MTRVLQVAMGCLLVLLCAFAGCKRISDWDRWEGNYTGDGETVADAGTRPPRPVTDEGPDQPVDDEAEPTEDDEAEPTEDDEAEPTEDDEAEPTEDDEAEPTDDDEAEPAEDDEAEPVEADETRPTDDDDDRDQVIGVEDAVSRPRTKVGIRQIRLPSVGKTHDELVSEIISDLDCVARQVRAAVDLAEDDPEEAERRISKARRAVSFVFSELPSMCARQHCERAMTWVSRQYDGAIENATLATQSALALAPDIHLRARLSTFTQHGSDALDMLEERRFSDAREHLEAMAKAIVADETELVAERIDECLRQAVEALEAAPDVATSWLDYAEDAIDDLEQMVQGL